MLVVQWIARQPIKKEIRLIGKREADQWFPNIIFCDSLDKCVFRRFPEQKEQ